VDRPPLGVQGVGQLANDACAVSVSALPRPHRIPELSESSARGVAHPKQSLADVRRADARSAEISRCKGVGRCFHVSVNKIEPDEAVRARNLLTKDNARISLADEPEEVGPEVTRIGEAVAFPGRAERLAGTGTGPNRSIIWPACKSQRVAPSPDAGEEMTLGESGEVIGLHFLDRSLVHFARRDQPSCDEIAEPLGCERVELVVVGGAHFTLPCAYRMASMNIA
jgi:hypothetical protein